MTNQPWNEPSNPPEFQFFFLNAPKIPIFVSGGYLYSFWDRNTGHTGWIGEVPPNTLHTMGWAWKLQDFVKKIPDTFGGNVDA